MPGYNHIDENEKRDEIIAAVAETGTRDLLFSYASLIAAPGGQPITVPIVVGNEKDGKRNLVLGQGLERMVTLKAIVENLAIRIDGGRVR